MRTLIACVLLSCLASPAGAGPNWPSFRGPTSDGRSDAATTALRWSETRNIAWKTGISGEGWSSPVVWGDQVWVTSATPDGKKLFALCVDLATGRILRKIKVFHVEKPHPKLVAGSSYASPSPVIEAGRVYVHFGTYGTACVDTNNGKKLWERRDLTLDHKEGAGSSPALFGDLLILHCDGQDVQYVIALDKQTGKTKWKTDRSADFRETVPYQRKAYATPLVADLPEGRQLLSVGARAAYGYDPATGKELWKVHYTGWSNVSNAVYGGGLVFVNCGYGQAELWAVRPNGKGDVTDSHMVWKLSRGVPGLSSPVLIGDWLFICSDDGLAGCVQAKTGKLLWQQRLGGKVSASPVFAGGRLYIAREDGRTSVLRAGPTFELLAVNPLEGMIRASPAVVGRALILRTESHLYCIEE